MKNRLKKYFVMAMAMIMAITTLPFHSFKDNSNTVYGAEDKILVYQQDHITNSATQRVVSQSDLDLAKNEVLGQNVELFNNQYGTSVDLKIYAMYGIIAYGSPSFSDMKFSERTGRLEFRTLGTDVTGQIIITNNDYPNDASSGVALTDKNWQINDYTLSSWGNYKDDEIMKNYILTAKGVINDTELIPYSIKEILAKTGISDTAALLPYVKILSFPSLRTNGAVQLIHKTSSGKIWYDTFTIPAITTNTDFACTVNTDSATYKIMPDESYVDVNITIKGQANIGSYSNYLDPSGASVMLGSFTGAYSQAVNNTKSGSEYTYTKKFNKTDLAIGDNIIKIHGKADFKSIFTADNPLPSSYGETTIKITVYDEKLKADLVLPTFANVNENYTAINSSFIPVGKTVKSATLEKSTDGVNFTAVTWNGNSVSQSYFEKGNLTYRLTVELMSGEIDTDTETIEIIDNRPIDGVANLELPGYTYVGHPVIAKDNTTLTIEGESYTGTRIYKNNLATNKFTVLGTTNFNYSSFASDKSLMEYAFGQTGTFGVKLDVTTKQGNVLTDTKYIDVLKTPYISERLGGTQKQNRRQVLDITIAISPNNRVENLDIDIVDVLTNEKVTAHLTGTATSTNIKTRALLSNPKELYENYTLEFLTKNTDTRQYSYRIYARDSKNDTDIKTGTFTVVPDTAPIADIDVPPSNTRAEGGGDAGIPIEDISSSLDGDSLSRTWEIAFDTNHNNLFTDEVYKPLSQYTYTDYSFGAVKKIKLNKSDLGKVDIRLHVDDVWTEGTLSEYVTAADIKSSNFSKTTEVINIAPKVSLELEEKKEDIGILILSNEGNYTDIPNLKSSIVNSFKEDNIQVNVRSKQINKQKPRDSFNYRGKGTAQILASDDNNLYVMDDEGLRSYNLDTNSYNFIKAPAYIPPSPKITFDLDYTYVFLTSGDRTSILDKNTGEILTTLYTDLSNKKVYVYDETTWYLISDNKVEKFNTLSQAISLEFSLTGFSGSNLVDGKVHFVRFIDNKIKRVVYDFENKQYEEYYLADNNKYLGYDTDFQDRLVHFYANFTKGEIDTKGNIFMTTYSTYKYSYSYQFYYIWTLGIDNNNKVVINTLIEDYDRSLGNISTIPIKNEKGEFTAVLTKQGTYSSSVSRYSWQVNINSYTSSLTYHKSGGDYNMCRMPVAYARDYSHEGTIIIGLTEGTNQATGNMYYYYITIGNTNFIDKTSSACAYLQTQSFRYIGDSYWNEYTNVFIEYYYLLADNSLVSEINCFRNDNTFEDNITRTFRREFNLDDNLSKEILILVDNVSTDAVNTTELASKIKTDSIDFIHLGSANYGKTLANLVPRGISKSYSTDMNVNAQAVKNILNLAQETYMYGTNLKAAASSTSKLESPLINVDTKNKDYYYSYDIMSNKSTTSNTLDIASLKDTVDATAYTTFRNNFGIDPNADYWTYGTPYTPSFTNIQSTYYKRWLQNISSLYSPSTNTVNSYINQTLEWGANITHEMSFTINELTVFKFDYDSSYANSQPIKTFSEVICKLNNETLINSSGGDVKSISKVLSPGTYRMTITSISSVTMSAYQNRYKHHEFKNFSLTPMTAVLNIFEKKGETVTPTMTTVSTNWYDGNYGKRRYNIEKTFTIPQGAIFEYTLSSLRTDGLDPFEYPCMTKIRDITLTQDGVVKFKQTSNNSFQYNGKNILTPGTHKIVLNYIYWDYHGYPPNAMTFGNFKTTAIQNYSSFIDPVNPTPKVIQGTIESDKIYNITNKLDFTKELYTGNNVTMLVDFKDSTKIILDPSNISTTADVVISNFKVTEIDKATGESHVLFYDDFKDITLTNSKWTKTFTGAASMSLLEKNGLSLEEAEKMGFVYKKGENVPYNIYYSDYERDSSKISYFRYTHTPLNDGLHPNHGQWLNQPIRKFNIDGKYVVEHYQIDNTGLLPYDKQSNIVNLIFYIRPSLLNLPTVESIQTIPNSPNVGEDINLKYIVADKDRSTLNTKLELYREKDLIYTFSANGLLPDASGIYAPVTTGKVNSLLPGKYTVIVTVTDENGTGMGSYSFTPKSLGNVIGEVRHTDKWNENRISYNLAKSGTENSPRPYNTFWNGERFMLKAVTEGSPNRVHVQIVGEPKTLVPGLSSYETNLTTTDNINWTGSLWDKSFTQNGKFAYIRWGKTAPETLTFRFTAYFNDGTTKVHDIDIIVDHRDPYYNRHQLF